MKQENGERLMDKKSKCIFCYKNLTEKDVVLSSSHFVYCKHCKNPIFNYDIQDKNHWSKQFDIEKKEDIDLLMEGYL